MTTLRSARGGISSGRRSLTLFADTSCCCLLLLAGTRREGKNLIMRVRCDSNWGWFFLGTLLLGSSMYVGGTLAYTQNTQGRAQLPHREFWTGIRSLISDGVSFTLQGGKFKGRAPSGGGYEAVPSAAAKKPAKAAAAAAAESSEEDESSEEGAAAPAPKVAPAAAAKAPATATKAPAVAANAPAAAAKVPAAAAAAAAARSAVAGPTSDAEDESSSEDELVE